MEMETRPLLVDDGLNLQRADDLMDVWGFHERQVKN